MRPERYWLVVCSGGEAREVSWGTVSTESSVGGCFRFSEASFARRAFRSVAAASREAWLEAMILEWARSHSLKMLRGAAAGVMKVYSQAILLPKGEIYGV